MVAMKKTNKNIPKTHSSTSDRSTKKKKVTYHYLKTKNYRTFYADGIFGGLTSSGKIYFDLYIERKPTPKTIEHEITTDYKLGKEIKREGKEGIIREIESGVIIDISTAEILSNWLNNRIEDYKEAVQALEPKEVKADKHGRII